MGIRAGLECAVLTFCQSGVSTYSGKRYRNSRVFGLYWYRVLAFKTPKIHAHHTIAGDGDQPPWHHVGVKVKKKKTCMDVEQYLAYTSQHTTVRHAELRGYRDTLWVFATTVIHYPM